MLLSQATAGATSGNRGTNGSNNSLDAARSERQCDEGRCGSSQDRSATSPRVVHDPGVVGLTSSRQEAPAGSRAPIHLARQGFAARPLVVIVRHAVLALFITRPFDEVLPPSTKRSRNFSSTRARRGARPPPSWFDCELSSVGPPKWMWHTNRSTERHRGSESDRAGRHVVVAGSFLGVSLLELPAPRPLGAPEDGRSHAHTRRVDLEPPDHHCRVVLVGSCVGRMLEQHSMSLLVARTGRLRSVCGQREPHFDRICRITQHIVIGTRPSV